MTTGIAPCSFSGCGLWKSDFAPGGSDGPGLVGRAKPGGGGVRKGESLFCRTSSDEVVTGGVDLGTPQWGQATAPVESSVPHSWQGASAIGVASFNSLHDYYTHVNSPFRNSCRRGPSATTRGHAPANAKGGGPHPDGDGQAARDQSADAESPGERKPEYDPEDSHPPVPGPWLPGRGPVRGPGEASAPSSVLGTP